MGLRPQKQSEFGRGNLHTGVGASQADCLLCKKLKSIFRPLHLSYAERMAPSPHLLSLDRGLEITAKAFLSSARAMHRKRELEKGGTRKAVLSSTTGHTVPVWRHIRLGHLTDGDISKPHDGVGLNLHQHWDQGCCLDCRPCKGLIKKIKNKSQISSFSLPSSFPSFPFFLFFFQVLLMATGGSSNPDMGGLA